MTIAARPLRTHQRQVFGLMAAIAAGEAPGITAALAAVTPGGGKSLLPVTFGALDGEASWLEGGKTAADPPRVGPHRLSGPYPTETTRPALSAYFREVRAHSGTPRPLGASTIRPLDLTMKVAAEPSEGEMRRS